MRDLVPPWGGRSNLLRRLPEEKVICLSVSWWFIDFSTCLISFALGLHFSKMRRKCTLKGIMRLTLRPSLNRAAELMFRQKTEEALQPWTRAPEKGKE